MLFYISRFSNLKIAKYLKTQFEFTGSLALLGEIYKKILYISERVVQMRWYKGTLFIFVLVLFCIGQMLIFPLIDTPRLRSNATEAVDKIWAQGVNPEIIGGFAGARYDNYTSVLIIKTAAYTGPETAMQKAFGGFRVEVPIQEDTDAWGAYCTYEDATNVESGGLSYSRYWHGYSLPLRILLCFFTFSNIQLLCYGLELLLIIASVILLYKRGLTTLLPGWCFTLLIMIPAMMGICIQFVPCMLLFLCGSVFLLRCKERIDRSIGMGFFFAALGLLTSYFDLLTFPTVTLTIPLLILYSMDRHENKTPALLPLCICWGLGYSLMWSLKWLLNGLILDTSLFGGVLAQMRLRISSSSNGVQYTRMEALMKNIRMVFGKPAYLFAFFLSLIVTLIRGYNGKKCLSGIFSLSIPFTFPLLFMLATANHIYDHGYFTYRNLAGPILALYILIASLNGGLTRHLKK